jgi:hypothetical protein
MAVMRVGYCRRSARSACKNWRIELGCEEEGGYSAGEIREGITSRWIESGGEETSWRCIFCRIAGNGEDLVVRGMGI